jgi:hypothetical protein
MFKPRNYRYKGINPGSEQKRFWLMLLIALAIVAAILYFF